MDNTMDKLIYISNDNNKFTRIVDFVLVKKFGHYYFRTNQPNFNKNTYSF